MNSSQQKQHHIQQDMTCAIADTTIPPKSCKAIPTGLSMTIPPGHGRIALCSGLATKHNINVGTGVIDPDYRGE
eukprot:6971447-Ditylum_brightwellii.AAC.1